MREEIEITKTQLKDLVSELDMILGGDGGEDVYADSLGLKPLAERLRAAHDSPDVDEIMLKIIRPDPPSPAMSEEEHVSRSQDTGTDALREAAKK